MSVNDPKKAQRDFCLVSKWRVFYQFHSQLLISCALWTRFAMRKPFLRKTNRLSRKEDAIMSLNPSIFGIFFRWSNFWNVRKSNSVCPSTSRNWLVKIFIDSYKFRGIKLIIWGFINYNRRKSLGKFIGNVNFIPYIKVLQERRPQIWKMLKFFYRITLLPVMLP